MAGRLPTKSEKRLWRQVMVRAEPLAGSTAQPRPEDAESMAALLDAGEARPTAPRPSPAPKTQATRTPPTAKARPLSAGDGLDARTALRLKRGKLPIDRTLDLHGMGRLAARDALIATLRSAYLSGERVILTITGKGPLPEGGVIRQSLPHWLAEDALRGLVLGSSIAAPHHGGSGARYILLRRMKSR